MLDVRRCEVILGIRTPGTPLCLGVFAARKGRSRKKKWERREGTTTENTRINQCMFHGRFNVHYYYLLRLILLILLLFIFSVTVNNDES